jgi:hypothetical protein
LVDQSQNIDSTLGIEMSRKLLPKDETTANPGWTSYDIWSDMAENSHYYMFMDNRNLHFASFSRAANGPLSLAGIYRHKKNPSIYTDTDISNYFMIAQRLTAPPDFLPAGWRLKSINVQFGSFVATYTNGTTDAIYSAAENIFPLTTATATSTTTTTTTGTTTDAGAAGLATGLTANNVAALDSSSFRSAVIAQPVGPAVIAQPVGPAVIVGPVLPAVVAQAAGPAGPVLPAVVAQAAGPAGPVLPAVVAQTVGPAVPLPSVPSSTLGWASTSGNTCESYIEPYNKKYPAATIACPPAPIAFSDATSKLVVTLVYKTTSPDGRIDVGNVQHNVGMEKRGETWSGFSAFFAGWIRIDVTGTKIKFTVPRPDGNYEQKEMEVKKDPAVDKQYTFEGGTVQYTGENPFETTGLSTGAIIGIVIAVVAAIVIFGLVIFFATSAPRRESARGFFHEKGEHIKNWGSRTRDAISERLGRRPSSEGQELLMDGQEGQDFELDGTYKDGS